MSSLYRRETFDEVILFQYFKITIVVSGREHFVIQWNFISA